MKTLHRVNPIELDMMSMLCKELDTSLSLRISLLLKHKEYAQIVSLSIDPLQYVDREVFVKDYMLVKFLSKWKGFSKLVKFNTRLAAEDTWISVELQNFITNNRLKGFKGDNPLANVILRARAKIADILGPFNKDKVMRHARWSNGATVDLKHGTSLDKKISTTQSVTLAALPHAQEVFSNDLHWFESLSGVLPSADYCIVPRLCFNVVKSNRYVTVPKTAKTDRSICAEPTANAFLQQGVLSYMNERLDRYGIRLDDQSINQNYAALAYNFGLATVDLQNASDSLATELVYLLLPIDWCFYLDDLRCKHTNFRGRDVELSKFSSMGNAFSFPLESLIFYALAESVSVDSNVSFNPSVFGDDIIIAKECYPRFVEVLSFCGFDVNLSKSYHEGNFFESCGKHYFQGYDVTPVYQKEVLSLNGEREYIRLHNRLYRWVVRQQSLGIFKSAARLSFRVRKILPQQMKDTFIPDFDTSDDGYLTSVTNLKEYDRNYGYKCRTLVFVPKRIASRCETALLAAKLRIPQFSNTHRKGWSENVDVSRGLWKYKVRYFQVRLNGPSLYGDV